jgi:hypothetical protein
LQATFTLSFLSPWSAWHLKTDEKDASIEPNGTMYRAIASLAAVDHYLLFSKVSGPYFGPKISVHAFPITIGPAKSGQA